MLRFAKLAGKKKWECGVLGHEFVMSLLCDNDLNDLVVLWLNSCCMLKLCIIIFSMYIVIMKSIETWIICSW